MPQGPWQWLSGELARVSGKGQKLNLPGPGHIYN